MDNIPKQFDPVLLTLKEQFSDFEAKSRSEFDENGWGVFTDKIKEYINDLYVGTRRECISRVENEMTPKFSGKDAERASMRLDFQRLYGHKQKRYGLQIGALVSSLFTGIIANWAFSDIHGVNPSTLPWVILVVISGITIVLSSLSFIKDMEP